MMSQKEFIELYVNADEDTKKRVDDLVHFYHNDTNEDKPRRDIDKILTEYDSKYDPRIYATEINYIRSKSRGDEWELMMNCIKFGYVLGRRAEKRARYTRNKNK